MTDVSINSLSITAVTEHAQVIRQLTGAVSDVNVSIDGLTVTLVMMDTPYAGFLSLPVIAATGGNTG